MNLYSPDHHSRCQHFKSAGSDEPERHHDERDPEQPDPGRDLLGARGGLQPGRHGAVLGAHPAGDGPGIPALQRLYAKPRRVGQPAAAGELARAVRRLGLVGAAGDGRRALLRSKTPLEQEAARPPKW